MPCCTCCSLKAIGIFGVIFSILFGLVAVAGIVLGGIQFKMLDFSWVTETNWGALGIIAIVAIVIIAFATILGLVEFCCCKESCCCTVIFLIIELIVLLFALAIAVFGLISSAIGIAVDEIGCDTEFKGIMDFWKDFDVLFNTLDYGLCSEDCQCAFTETIKAEFVANTTIKKYFDKWNKEGSKTDLSQCPDIENKIEKIFNETQEGKEKKNNVNVTKFGKYWKIVEEQFNCTGWCKDKYILNEDLDGNPISPYEGGFYKYLYSGINRGVVMNGGCMKKIADWLPPLIQAYGIIGVIASVLCFFTWILALMLLCNCYKEKRKNP